MVNRRLPLTLLYVLGVGEDKIDRARKQLEFDQQVRDGVVMAAQSGEYRREFVAEVAVWVL